MNGEEWRKGMENEAESVNDTQWAQDARQAALQYSRLHQWQAFGAALGALVLGYLAVTATLNLISLGYGPRFLHQPPGVYTALGFLFTFLLGLFLAQWKMSSPRIAVLPLMAALIALLICQFVNLQVAFPGQPDAFGNQVKVDILPEIAGHYGALAVAVTLHTLVILAGAWATRLGRIRAGKQLA